MKFGFSTGPLWQTIPQKEALRLVRAAGCNAVELGLINFDRFKTDWLDELSEEDFVGFEWISVHSSKITYGNNPDTRYIFDKLARLNKLVSLDCIVIHPDIVEDFSVFQNTDLPFAFENMDKRKESFQTPEELDELTKKYGFNKFVLDVNHIFTVDPTMELAKRFYEIVGDRIVEIQVSGYKTLHDPFVETQQTNIIKAVQNPNVPIIDEAKIAADILEAEREFVLKHLKS